MKLKDAIHAQTTLPGPKCGLEILFATLSKPDIADLSECLADPSLKHTQISRGLRAEGHTVSADIIARHRKGECSCGR